MTDIKIKGLITAIIGFLIIGLVAYDLLKGTHEVFAGFGVIGLVFVIIGIKKFKS